MADRSLNGPPNYQYPRNWFPIMGIFLERSEHRNNSPLIGKAACIVYGFLARSWFFHIRYDKEPYEMHKRTLVNVTGLSPGAVYNALEELDELALIEWERDPRGGRYNIVLCELPDRFEDLEARWVDLDAYRKGRTDRYPYHLKNHPYGKRQELVKVNLAAHKKCEQLTKNVSQPRPLASDSLTFSDPHISKEYIDTLNTDPRYMGTARKEGDRKNEATLDDMIETFTNALGKP